jgi:hypothetical protein
MQATGEPGWHFIDLYPAIYKGKETRPVNYRLPQLTAEQDHPGEDLPIFHFAFVRRSSVHCGNGGSRVIRGRTFVKESRRDTSR